MTYDPLRIPRPSDLATDGPVPDHPFDRSTLHCPVCGAQRFRWNRMQQFLDDQRGSTFEHAAQRLTFELAICTHCRHVLWFEETWRPGP